VKRERITRRLTRARGRVSQGNTARARLFQSRERANAFSRDASNEAQRCAKKQKKTKKQRNKKNKETKKPTNACDKWNLTHALSNKIVEVKESNSRDGSKRYIVVFQLNSF